MNKAELVTSVAGKSGLTKKDAEKAIDAVLQSIEDALKAKEKVQLVGFGTFEVKSRAPRIGRNPKTGAELHIPASNAPAFKAGKTLKEAVN